jgi:glycogen debranching enzyme
VTPDAAPFDTLVTPPGNLDRITLVNGRTFIVARRDGSLLDVADGVVVDDLRMLSRFWVSVDDLHPSAAISVQPLATATPTPFHAVVVGRPDPAGHAGQELYVQRWWIGQGARVDIEVHNHAAGPVERVLTIHARTDFAHVFDVKACRALEPTSILAWGDDGGALLDSTDATRTVRIQTDPPPDAVDASSSRIRWQLSCGARRSAIVSVTFEPRWDQHVTPIAFPLGEPPSEAWPAVRHERWKRAAPTVGTNDTRLSAAIAASVADLAALRMQDKDHADRVVVAAGAPWFMTLFGRDSLITSWMTLPFLPELALGTIDSLADLQGTAIRPETEEEPGKILHELRRRGADAAFAHRGRYFGTVDATPLFVMVVGETVRWHHLATAALWERWPSVLASLDWLRRRVTVGGGFVRYQRSTHVGLANQGWKDSWDGVASADGTIPSGPIALVEVQGYAYAALLAGAALSERLVGDGCDPGVDPDRLRREAVELADRFDDRFWIERESSYALALDGDDRRVDAICTNPGHAIWTGIAPTDRALRCLDRLVDDLFSGWGLRTLSPRCVRFDPLSYHNGSVWPHDTALVAAGAARLGRWDVADLLADAALDVTLHGDGRPPELFAGVDRATVDVPVPYPSSCSPQAWASASTLLHLRNVLGLEPPTGAGEHPELRRAALGVASLRGIHVGDHRWAATHSGDRWSWEAAD